MGDFIFGMIIVCIYGLIIYRLLKTYRMRGHICSCPSCPVSEFVRKDGKIDLLAAVEAMNKEE